MLPWSLLVSGYFRATLQPSRATLTTSERQQLPIPPREISAPMMMMFDEDGSDPFPVSSLAPINYLLFWNEMKCDETIRLYRVVYVSIGGRRSIRSTHDVLCIETLLSPRKSLNYRPMVSRTSTVGQRAVQWVNEKHQYLSDDFQRYLYLRSRVPLQHGNQWLVWGKKWSAQMVSFVPIMSLPLLIYIYPSCGFALGFQWTGLSPASFEAV